MIGRAGASTIAELTAAGRPSILVPLPTAMDNHQAHNANALEEAGGGWMMPQEGFTASALSARLESFLSLPQSLARAAANARKAGRINARAGSGVIGTACDTTTSVPYPLETNQRGDSCMSVTPLTRPKALPFARNMPLTVGVLHFVGIGGIGMSGIAEILHTLGYRVQGTDIAESANVERLRGLGIAVAIGHQSAHLKDAAVWWFPRR